MMSTGHHAAVRASATRGGTVAVVGDSAVGLSAVLELTSGRGVDATPECVGTQQSIDTAAAIGVLHGEVRFNQPINPPLVLDFEMDLDGTPEAYAAMDERRAIKSLIQVGSL